MTENKPLHSQLYSVMVDRINSGAWKAGERVPSEKELLAEFGTSRGPVRQALARLRTEGFIAGGRGAPPTVQKAVPSQSFDTYISFTEWAEELGHVPGQKTIEVSRRLADEQSARHLGLTAGSQMVEVVRLRMFGKDPVMLERSFYPFEVGKHLLAADLDASSIYQILREHDIFPTRARNVIDAVAAGEFEAHWLGVDLGSPLLRVRREAFDQEGKVVDFVENCYLPSKATFAVENTRFVPNPFTRVTLTPGDAGAAG